MKKLAVLGHPIDHTLSPVMHNASIQALGLAEEYEYGKLDVRPDALMERLTQLPSEGYIGVNLTIPLKEVAFQNLKQLDSSATILGAVNTVEFSKTGFIGHNTDAFGFLQGLRAAFGKSVEGDGLFLLGCGGAGRAVALTAALNGARAITLFDIDRSRMLRLMEEIQKASPFVRVRLARAQDKLQCCREADLVIQASPVGMKKKDRSLLPPAAFCEGQRVFDLIYMYPETAFLSAAKSAGARIANGLSMLLHQGAKAFEIWTGMEPDIAAMRRALEKAVCP